MKKVYPYTRIVIIYMVKKILKIHLIIGIWGIDTGFSKMYNLIILKKS